MFPFATLANDIERLVLTTGRTLTSPTTLPARASIFAPQSTVENNKFVMKFPLPGVDPEDINVRISDGTHLVVSYHREDEDGHRSESRAYVAQLPEEADLSSAYARFENGLVILTLLKTDRSHLDIELTLHTDGSKKPEKTGSDSGLKAIKSESTDDSTESKPAEKAAKPTPKTAAARSTKSTSTKNDS